MWSSSVKFNNDSVTLRNLQVLINHIQTTTQNTAYQNVMNCADKIGKETVCCTFHIITGEHQSNI